MAERGVEVDHSMINRACVEVRSRAGQTNSTPSEFDKRFLARGRNLHPGQGSVEVSVSRRGFDG